MKCPACGSEMIERDFGGVMVDVCGDGCGGLWFDWAELLKLDETNEGCGKALREALDSPRSTDEGRDRLVCTKCGTPMHAHLYQSSRAVTVDECYVCGGFFLDAGELKLIRNTFMTDEEEEAFTNKLLAGMPEYQEAKRNLDREKSRAEAARHLTRFLRLSYYLTGE